LSLPYFNLYPTDFEAKTSHLTLEEDGAYNRLLRLCWMMPGCSIPDDNAWIMRRMRVDQDTFERVVLVVIQEFFTSKNGRLSNDRMNRELALSTERHSKRVSAGKKGGTAKALKSLAAASSNAKAMLYQPEPEPEPDIREEDTNVSSVVSMPDGSADCLAHFNATADRVGWPQVQKFSKPRRAALSQRIKDVGGVENWCEAIDRAAQSPLLTGQTGNGWKADFDWLAKPANFTKLLEGNYDPRNQSNSTATRPGANRATENLMAGFAAVAARHSGTTQ
jgi:uncharacterized protein YdaU (DUF1376 family)